MCCILISFLRFGIVELGKGVIFNLISILISAALGALSFRSSRWYLNNRSTVILVYQSIILIAWTVFVFPSPLFWQYLPLDLETSLMGRLKNLWLSPALLFQVRFSA